MTKRILIIQGHPDPAGGHLCHMLADAYAAGAAEAGHEVTRIAVAALDFPLVRTQEDFMSGTMPQALEGARSALVAAEHVVVVFPLWLGTMPALLKGFFEQLLRPGFAYAYAQNGGFPRKLLNGRSARVVVTMGMPAFIFRLYYLASGVKVLERNILAFVGMAPVRSTLIGNVEGAAAERVTRWKDRLFALGRVAG